MGEIKSTLDLVMEKTRNLSLSPEEKETQQKADFEKRLQGLLQQYADNMETVDSLQERISTLQAELDVSDSRLLIETVFKRIDPDRDNQQWLALLHRMVPDALEPVQDSLAEYARRRDDLIETTGRRLLDQLAQDHEIGGTAVLPNPVHDSGYQKNLERLKQRTQTQIDAVFQQFIGS